MLGLKAIGVGPGDSVVVPAFSCPASALPVLALGADVSFADVDADTFELEWPQVEQALRPNTKAVVVVHLFGHMAEIGDLLNHCQQREIALLEDAALAFGAEQHGRRAGTIGVAGCLSFHPRKMITTGEGGAVCTNDPQIAASVERDRAYGAAVSAWARFQDSSGEVRGFERLAYNLKLTDIQAAIGIAQMRRLPGFIAARASIAARYLDAFADISMLRLPSPGPLGQNVFQAFVCLWEPQPLQVLSSDATAMQQAMASLAQFRSSVAAKGVAISDAAQFLPALAVFRNGRDSAMLPDAYPIAMLAANLAFALPIFPGMSEAELGCVLHAVLDAASDVGNSSRR
jgi:dTDP-4-amino-4,6-dideoxygalactose transaminase